MAASWPSVSQSSLLVHTRRSLTFHPLLHHRPVCLRSANLAIRITAYASSNNNNSNNNGNGFDLLTSRLVDAARSLRLRASKFIESQNLQDKFQEANRKFEELRYDARKGAQDFDRRFRVSERAQEVVDFANEQARNVDQQFGVVQKFRNATFDFRRNWPSYKRQVEKFLQTPVGQTFTTLAFLWFLLSGWLFRIFLLSLWLLPFAPLLINSATKNIKNMVIEGNCPSCKMRFIGNRNQMVVCNYCRAVVWQPRQDFSSKDQSDPSIIDVDID